MKVPHEDPTAMFASIVVPLQCLVTARLSPNCCNGHAHIQPVRHSLSIALHTECPDEWKLDGLPVARHHIACQCSAVSDGIGPCFYAAGFARLPPRGGAKIRFCHVGGRVGCHSGRGGAPSGRGGAFGARPRPVCGRVARSGPVALSRGWFAVHWVELGLPFAQCPSAVRGTERKASQRDAGLPLPCYCPLNMPLSASIPAVVIGV